MSLSGIFSDKNRDKYNFLKDDGTISAGGTAHINDRRKVAEKIERDGVVYYKYYLIAPINHGLARQEKPLPAGYQKIA